MNTHFGFPSEKTKIHMAPGISRGLKTKDNKKYAQLEKVRDILSSI